MITNATTHIFFRNIYMLLRTLMDLEMVNKAFPDSVYFMSGYSIEIEE